MGKKEKLQISHLETEVDRITTLHTDLTNQHASLQAKHFALEAKTADLTKIKEESTALKLSLAQQENKYQELQKSHAAEHAILKQELEEAQESAKESAEAAEAAAETATAAAAAAAAMAVGDDSSDEEGEGDGGDGGDEAIMRGDTEDEEIKREGLEVEKAAMREHIDALRSELKEEHNKRKTAEKRCKNLEDSQGLTSISKQLNASEEAAHKSSSDLVAQAEKNLKLHDKLSKVRSKLQSAEESVATVRRALIGEVAGQDAEFELYEHVSFADLARLALQGKRNGVGGGSSEEGKNGEGKDSSNTLTTTAPGQSLDAIRKAEAEIKSLRSALRQAQSEVNVQRSLASKGKAAEHSLQQLKEKNMELANRVAREKDRYVNQKDETRRRDDRLQALSDHIEKLMIHLKHEAAAKAKAVDQQRRAGRETDLLKQRNTALTQKNRAREKVIRELKEGCRILEDQLRLMDTKYVELRNKLDWTRTQSSKEVRRIQSEANKLRVKWMMVAGSDTTLNALGITGGEDIPNIQDQQQQQQQQQSGNNNNKKVRRSESTGDLPPVQGGKQRVLGFEAPDIQDVNPADQDSPWGGNKLNELSTSLGGR